MMNVVLKLMIWIGGHLLNIPKIIKNLRVWFCLWLRRKMVSSFTSVWFCLLWFFIVHQNNKGDLVKILFSLDQTQSLRFGSNRNTEVTFNTHWPPTHQTNLIGEIGAKLGDVLTTSHGINAMEFWWNSTPVFVWQLSLKRNLVSIESGQAEHFWS